MEVDGGRVMQRFPADDLIKANGEAEAAELSRTRSRLKGFQEAIKETERLNSESIRVQEQTADILRKIDAAVSGLADNKSAGTDTASADCLSRLEEIRLSLEGLNRLEEMASAMESLSKLDGIEEIRSSIAALETKDNTGEIIASVTALAEKDNSQELKVAIEALSERIDTQLTEKLASLVSQEKSAQEEEGPAAGFDNEAVKALIKEELAAFRTSVEEYVHREGVMVYKNVQAAVVQVMDTEKQNISRDISDSVSAQMEENTNRVKSVHVLLAMGCIATFVNLALLIAQCVGLFR